MRNKYLIPITVCVLCMTACSAGKGDGSTLSTDVSGYVLMMDKSTGSLVSFGKEGNNLLSDSGDPLFILRFRDDDGTPARYTAADAGKCTSGKKGKNLTFVYSDFPDRDFEVSVSVKPDKEDGLFHFSMKVDTDGQVEWMEYPCVTVKETSSEDEGILWPYNEGGFFSDASKHAYVEPEYPSHGSYGMYPGMVLTPFIAQVTRNGGVYLGAHDPDHNTRHVDFRSTEDGIRLHFRLYPGVEKGNFSSGDETVLGGFEGDWYSAADIYRRHFDSNHEGFVRLDENKSLPKWYFDPYVVVTYCVRGHHDMDDMKPNRLFPYVNAIPIIKDFTDVTGAPVMALLMHWEGTAPWAPPYVWPPYGGEEALREFVDRMHGIGGEVGVYCSGMGWTQKSNVAEYDRSQEFEEKHLADEMCIAPDGSLPPSRICTGQRSGYDLCPATEFTKTTLSEEMKKIRSAGVAYVQMMDQNHGGTPYMCYSRDHGHPAVPGKWESEEANELYERILKDNPDLVLGCESAAAEPFIPKLLFSDNRNGLNFNGGRQVPLYSYIYHEYVTNFMGNNVCGDIFVNCRKTPEIFQYRLAYSFLAGDFLTVVIDDGGRIQWAWGQRDFSPDYWPDREASLSLIKTLTGWRKAMPEFLQFGRALHPLPYECGQSVIFTSTGSVSVPDVQCASYEYGGKTVHFLVNWRNTDVTVHSQALEGKEYSLRPDGDRVRSADGILNMPPLSVVAIWD